MQIFKVISAFYIKQKNALLVAVEGEDARFKSGAYIRDAFGRTYKIDSLARIDGISDENAHRFTTFIIKDCTDIGRLVQFTED